LAARSAVGAVSDGAVSDTETWLRKPVAGRLDAAGGRTAFFERRSPVPTGAMPSTIAVTGAVVEKMLHF
jgi:hypothetical protein